MGHCLSIARHLMKQRVINGSNAKMLRRKKESTISFWEKKKKKGQCFAKMTKCCGSFLLKSVQFYEKYQLSQNGIS